MNEEIKQALDYFNGWCEEGTNITITSDFIENVELLNDYITNLQEENKFLKDYKIAYENVMTANKMLEKEYQKLVKVIDELETFLKYEIYCNFNEKRTEAYEDSLNKLTELKGGSDDR